MNYILDGGIKKKLPLRLGLQINQTLANSDIYPGAREQQTKNKQRDAPCFRGGGNQLTTYMNFSFREWKIPRRKRHTAYISGMRESHCCLFFKESSPKQTFFFPLGAGMRESNCCFFFLVGTTRGSRHESDSAELFLNQGIM